MKKSFLQERNFFSVRAASFFMFLLFSFCAFPQNIVLGAGSLSGESTGQKKIDTERVPPLLLGAWESGDRIIFFDETDETDGAIDGATVADTQKPAALFSAILKTYYGWFYDRAAEPVSYSQATRRFRCTATPADAERISVLFEPLLSWMGDEEISGRQMSSVNSGAWEIVLRHSKREITRIPVAVIDGKLYLDFLIKGNEVTNSSEAQSGDNKVQGYWKGVSQKRGVLVAPLDTAENLYSYYFVDGAVYTLRYWKTNVDFVDTEASFKDGDYDFRVAKHLVSCGEVYTCATGRRTVIRNIEKSSSLNKNMTLDSTGTICAFGEPYLVKSNGIQSEENLMSIVASANSRRKPDPPPLFPPSDVNWYWDDIHRLEAGNAIIEAVRERQREFASH